MSLRVRDVMRRRLHHVSPTETLTKIAKLMADEDVGSVLVMKKNELAGLVVKEDIFKHIAAKELLANVVARDLMTEVKYIYTYESVERARELIATVPSRRLVVVNPQREVVGVIGMRTVARSPVRVPVSAIMRAWVVSVRPQDSANEVARLIAEHEVGSVIVYEGGKPVGIVVQNSLMRLAAEQGVLEGLVAEDMITEDYMFGDQEMDIIEARQALREAGKHRLIVTGENRRIVGIVSLRVVDRFVPIAYIMSRGLKSY